MTAKVLFKSNRGFLDIPNKLINGKKWMFFDMDGTLVDLGTSNYTLYREVIKTMYGLELTYDEWKVRFGGRRPQDSIPDFLRSKGLTIAFHYDKFISLAKPIKDNIIFNSLFKNSTIITGAKEYLTKLKKNGCRLLLATSTIRIYTESILMQYDIKNMFEQIITGEDVSRGKPDPQIYLLALEKNNASPGETIVFEDSTSGIKAALAADLDCIQISTLD